MVLHMGHNEKERAQKKKVKTNLLRERKSRSADLTTSRVINLPFQHVYLRGYQTVNRVAMKPQSKGLNSFSPVKRCRDAASILFP